jgi:hypothetical protein
VREVEFQVAIAALHLVQHATSIAEGRVGGVPEQPRLLIAVSRSIHS